MFKRLRLGKSRSQAEDETRRSSNSSDGPASEPGRGRPDNYLRAPSTSAPSIVRGKSPSPHPSPGPSRLGLHVLFEPKIAALDIIFVHGLGGSSHGTWIKDHDPSLFWPANWLPLEPDVGISRILTFGYNANWRGSTKSTSTITDFAKELLFEMRFAKDETGADLNIGSRPVIFVVHSMGGLVVKKAYLLGLHDENYKSIIASVAAVIFLSTPHRGTNLAETLNRIVSATFQSSKSYISDLYKSSSAIEELNEQFRHLAPGLSIWSFYETLETSIGPKRLMVLDKESAILGYPTEISKPLNADHQSICKYTSPTDSNYVSVRNAIKTLISYMRGKAEEGSRTNEAEESLDLADIFRDCTTSDNDYNEFRQRWIPNTCKWFMEQPSVSSWMSPSSTSSILWYNAPPASGKSILSAFVINQLKGRPNGCQFFHFKYADPSKRSVANCLKALVFQLAKATPEFRRLVCTSSLETLSLDSGDPRLVWRNALGSLLSKCKLDEPLYWVIDALDESDSPKLFLECIGGLATVQASVKVLVLSRNTSALSIGFSRVSRLMKVDIIEKSGGSHNENDIDIYVEQEIRHLHGSEAYQRKLKKTIMERSEGNFLWTKLVLDEVMDCHTEEDIQEVLDEIPDDMNLLYQRMERNLTQSTRMSSSPLIKALFEWSICAQRPLNLREMSQALQRGFPGLIDLQRTIKEACGQFLRVNESGIVSMLHHTAREYFVQARDSAFHVNLRTTHGKLFMTAIEALRDPELRWTLSQNQHACRSSHPFVFYCAIAWPYHLGHAQSVAPEYLNTLVEFLRSTGVLTWIHALALNHRLDVLVKASSVLTAFVRKTRRKDASTNPMLHRLSDLELLDSWIADLTKLVGKFGRNLVAEPEIIYTVVPALCPGQTGMFKQFHDASTSPLQVQGNEGAQWNDNLGRFALPTDSQAWGIACAPKFTAVLEFGGIVRLWDSQSFMEIRKILHGEPVTTIAISENGAKLATYGLKTTKVWSTGTGSILSSIASPEPTKAMSIVFADSDSKLLFGGDDNKIWSASCEGEDRGWRVLNHELLRETERADGTFINSPMCLAFSGDRAYVGVAYRGAPLSVWRLSDGRCIGKCRRAKEQRAGERRPSSNWFAVDRFTWNPVTGHVLGIYRDGCIFKWHPLTDENIEVRRPADEITASPNGKLFATSSSDGSIRIWNFSFFSVIYQLSAEDLVTSLVFSPDSRRFYDLRGSVVNAWEPDAVTRFFENESHVSDSNSNSEEQSSTTMSKASEERIAYTEAVTSIATAPDHDGYCAGYENGTVFYFGPGAAEGVEIANFGYFLDVTHIQWSNDGSLIAVANLGGDVQIKRVSIGGDSVRIEKLPNPKLQSQNATTPSNNSSNITDLVFSHDCALILVCTESDCFVYAVADGSLRGQFAAASGSQRTWICHPVRTDVLLACDVKGVHMHSWSTLEKLGTMFFDNEPGSSTGSEASAYDEHKRTTRVYASQDSDQLLFALTGQGAVRYSGTCRVADVDTCLTSEEARRVALNRIPHHICQLAYAPLGILEGRRFIFLDKNLWLCAYTLDQHGSGGTETCERYYFIPRDWADASSLARCKLQHDGTLLWPREDRVLRLKCDFDYSKAFTVV